MSDKPLFQNTDEQEAAYAPQELGAGSAERRDAAIEEGDTGGAAAGAGPAAVTPVVGGALAGGAISGQISGAPSNVPAAGPAIAGAALAGERDEGDEERDRIA